MTPDQDPLVSPTHIMMFFGLLGPFLIYWWDTRRQNRRMHDETRDQNRREHKETQEQNWAMHTQNQLRLTAIETQLKTQLEPMVTWWNGRAIR